MEHVSEIQEIAEKIASHCYEHNWGKKDYESLFITELKKIKLNEKMTNHYCELFPFKWVAERLKEKKRLGEAKGKTVEELARKICDKFCPEDFSGAQTLANRIINEREELVIDDRCKPRDD